VRYDYGREKILRCSNCALLYLYPWPDAEETEAVYGDTYFRNLELLQGQNRSIFGYTDYIAERFNKQPQFAEIAREIRSLLVPLDRTPRLLEVGCGFGYFLDEAFEEGFSVTGVEFNPKAIERLSRKYVFPIKSGALEKVELEPGGFDAVAMFDVIEHLRNPFVCIDKIYDALAPGGLLAISTLDAESLVSRLIGKRLEDFRRTREHLFFFSRHTLRRILEDHGFDLLLIRSIGHTFEINFLLNRLTLYNQPVFSALRRIVDKLGLGSLQLRVNPHTKMIAIARRRAQRLPVLGFAADSPVSKSVSELDRTLIDELGTLEMVNQRHYRWVFDAISPWLGHSILEVGSGIGVISKFLIPRCESLVLSDYQSIYLETLHERFGELPHLRYQLLDLNHAPYDVGGIELDTVLCVNVLEHIEDEEAALRGLARLLRTGGRLILQVPNYPWLFGSLDESYGHLRRYSQRTLTDALERSGFRVVAMRKFNPFSIPGWILLSKIFRARRLSVRALRLYDSLVPVMRAFSLLSHVAGLSLIVCAERR
jgi:2-polyprenyl-3-methyl-5-hydroxy-6-metoxy-1,4-benzoquinol methylase